MLRRSYNCAILLTILVQIQYTVIIDARDSINPIYHCSGIDPQQSLDIDQVLGRWYAVEMIHHREDTKYPRGREVVDACPLVQLTKTDINQIKLLWDERAGKLEYNFHIQDLYNKPGYWLSYGPQNGSLLKMPYNQFAGTVEVTKAVGTHMVLTFCTPDTELYSVVMSRDRQLPKAEILGVNKMLLHRGLQRFSIRETCKDAAIHNISNLFLICLLAIFVAKFS